jgi:hypothetical protein
VATGIGYLYTYCVEIIGYIPYTKYKTLNGKVHRVRFN